MVNEPSNGNGKYRNGLRLSKEVSLGNVLSIIFMVFSVSVWGLRLEARVNENSKDIATNNAQIYRDMTNQAKAFSEDLSDHSKLDAHSDTRKRVGDIEIRLATIERDDAVMSRTLDKLEDKLEEFINLLREQIERTNDKTAH